MFNTSKRDWHLITFLLAYNLKDHKNYFKVKRRMIKLRDPTSHMRLLLTNGDALMAQSPHQENILRIPNTTQNKESLLEKLCGDRTLSEVITSGNTECASVKISRMSKVETLQGVMVKITSRWKPHLGGTVNCII